MLTIAQALARGIDALHASDSPRLDAQLLLARAVGQTKEWLIAHADEPVSGEAQAAFDASCLERASGKPVAYILGSAWFYGREFLVDPHVLIPRPETEHLIDEALEYLRALQAPRVLDVGVGSGAIACTLASEAANAIVDAVDLSPDALRVARENAVRLHVDTRVAFFEGDLLAPLPSARTYDLVVANLPYVPTGEIEKPPAPVSFEPQLALDGGPDGLDAYRRLLPALPARLQAGGVVLLEAAPPLMRGLTALARTAFPDAAIDVRGDYGGRERYVCVCTDRPSTGSG